MQMELQHGLLGNGVSERPETCSRAHEEDVMTRETTQPEPQAAGPTQTDLAITRNVLAAERTLMAWIRTSLAMISFGFSIGKLGDVLVSTKVNVMFGRTPDTAGVAYYLVTIGTLSLMVAALQYRVDMARLIPRGTKRRPSLAFVIAVLLSLFGIFVFTNLVTRL
jgi:putative membrane protein